MKTNRAVVAASFAFYLLLILVVWGLPSGRFVLVLTNPLRNAGYGLSVVTDAGGTFVASGRYSWMTIGYSPDRDFPMKLMRAGAMLVLDQKLALGCLKGNEK